MIVVTVIVPPLLAKTVNFHFMLMCIKVLRSLLPSLLISFTLIWHNECLNCLQTAIHYCPITVGHDREISLHTLSNSILIPLGHNNKIPCFTGNFFSPNHACVHYLKFILVICDLCTIHSCLFNEGCICVCLAYQLVA